MGKMSKAKTAADALHAELCSAIADLAKSVDIAVTQMKLRAQCTAAIANADESGACRRIAPGHRDAVISQKD